MLQHLLMSYKYGTKQLYYFNTFDGAGDDVSERMEDSITLEIPEQGQFEEDCDSCTI